MLLVDALAPCDARGPADFLVILTEDESLPDSPAVDVLFDAFLSELQVRFFP